VAEVGVGAASEAECGSGGRRLQLECRSGEQDNSAWATRGLGSSRGALGNLWNVAGTTVRSGRGSSSWRQQWRVATDTTSAAAKSQARGGVLALLYAVDASPGREQHAGGGPESRSARMPRGSGEADSVGGGARPAEEGSE
jgi:hypothetical protein